MERPLLFGDGRLLGVLSEPTGAQERPCLLILNAGLIHRAGPGRLSVEVARHVARMGFATFRFDLSGLGDSEPRAESLDSIASAVADARQAMDAIGEALGVRRFVLFGLCSGAVHAHHIAAADPRVLGAVMLDGYVFNTFRSRVGAAVDRLRPVTQLPRRTLQWALRRFSAAPTSPALAAPDDGFLPRWPDRGRAKADLQVLRTRAVALLFVFSGEWESYRYRGQMAAAFRSVGYGSLLTEVWIPSAEHLYFARAERDLLLDTLAQWFADEPWDRNRQPQAA